MSTAATVMRADSPGVRPSILTGTVSLLAGLTLPGAESVSFSVSLVVSSPSHRTPIARLGIRFAPSSIAR